MPTAAATGAATRVLASPLAARAKAARDRGDLGIALFQTGRPELAGLGHQLLEAARTLPVAAPVVAWDFLAIALAVTGTDRFVVRGSAADGWTRVLALEVDLVDPTPWSAEADALASALRFLTGDIWHVHFHGGGLQPPAVPARVSDRDCVCLFSGGLDSLIGAADALADGRRPLLVSQASPKEGHVQARLANEVGLAEHRFDGRVNERYATPYEPSSRARSLLFIAYGVLAASTLPTASGALPSLLIPENGLISINPPLTRRRIGSLSTRTTHPFFIASLQRILQRAGLQISLVNPYSWKTKGEMLHECRGGAAIAVASKSYSCGKGKRLNQHCGRCVPCLIRRAAFHHAAVEDLTRYWADDLSQEGANDDVLAARFAAASLNQRDVAQWAAEAGPLPGDPGMRAGYVDVVRRGLLELRDFLDMIAWP